MVSCAPESGDCSSGAPAYTSRPTQTAPLPSSAPEPPCAEPSCLATVQQFTRHLGLSRRVATQLYLCRHQSTHCLYQRRWECYHAWCSRRGHSISSPSVPMIADFLMFFQTEKHLSLRQSRGTVPPWSPKFRLPELIDSFVLMDLISSFEIKRPRRSVGPPSWGPRQGFHLPSWRHL